MSTQSRTPAGDPSDTDPDSFEIGDWVVDREADDPDLARVINNPGLPSNEWDAYKTEDGDQLTVAETNPDYDSASPVVVCLFASQLEEHYPDWDASEPLKLKNITEDGVTHYGFPSGRLKPADEDAVLTHQRGEPPEPLLEMAEEVRSGATVDLVYQDGEWALDIEKIGFAYTITESGTVDGSGPHADTYREKAATFQ